MSDIAQRDSAPATTTRIQEPRWALPGLLLVAAAAAFAYAWRMDGALLEPYYAAAVRSMALDWRNFLYGAFDPAGTITLDKLPGAFWPQALSVRLFGVHAWAIVLPQVVEGVLTVLVLYRAVRRLAGPAAGLVAAAVLAASPVTVALNRGNIADTLMTLLLVLAAGATSSAVLTGRTRSLLLAGLWVGLAFQAKMVQAWLVLPALGLAFAAAGPGTPRRRVVQLGAAGLVAVAVSLGWMALVSLTPAASRPYVDGSDRNSIFEQVFAYNGYRRAGGWSPLAQLAELGLGGGTFEAPPASWHRLLAGPWGHATGWLLPAALISLVAVLAARRREPRGDPVRACLILWGTWLVVLATAFSATSTGWPYYAAALSPAIAALLGVGLASAWRVRRTGRGALAVAVAVAAVSVTYAAWLLPAEGTGLPTWLRPMLVAVGLAAEVLLAASLLSAGSRPKLSSAGLVAASAALLLVPASASVTVVFHRLGPFDTPFQPAARTVYLRSQLGRVPDVGRLERVRDGASYLLAAHPGGLAARFIFASGQKVLPIGGFAGSSPVPSLEKLKEQIAGGEFHLVVTLPTGDPRYAWIATHCSARGQSERAEIYYCRPADAQAPPAGR
jgi:4-amino-4-deoxy-L-arabinose transferase-like glycosyltransferase